MSLFRKIIHARVFLSRTSQRQFHTDFPDARDVPELLLYHGPYPTQTTPRDGEAFRQYMKVPKSDVLIGFFGTIKPYKNVAALSELPTTVNGRNVAVLIAGESATESRGDLLVLREKFGERLKHFDVRLSGRYFEQAMRACDVVMIPYRNAYNSGVALHALSCDTPILTSALPIFRELRDDFGRHWVRTWERDEAGRQLQDLLSSMPTMDIRDALHSKLEERSFTNAGGALISFVSRLLAACSPLPEPASSTVVPDKLRS